MWTAATWARPRIAPNWAAASSAVLVRRVGLPAVASRRLFPRTDCWTVGSDVEHRARGGRPRRPRTSVLVGDQFARHLVRLCHARQILLNPFLGDLGGGFRVSPRLEDADR